MATHDRAALPIEEEHDYEALPPNFSLTANMLAGAFAGIAEHSVMYPIDLLKTRIQIINPSPGAMYSGISNAMVTISRVEGFRALWKGLSSVVMGAGPAHAVYFASYEATKHALGGNEGGNDEHHPLAAAASGAAATISSDALMNPFDVIKQRMQLHGSIYKPTANSPALFSRLQGSERSTSRLERAMDAVSSVAPPALLSRTFADAAIARALHFSLSDSPVPEPSVGAADLGSYAAATTAPPTTSEPAAGGGPSRTPPSSARCRLGPAGGRAGKRRPRPSKRAPTTYISTDVATFPLMVQHVTGAQAEPQGVDAGLGLLLPPFDVDPLLPADTASAAAAHVAEYIRPPQEAAAEPQPCFPTLDSWNVMYGKNEVA